MLHLQVHQQPQWQQQQPPMLHMVQTPITGGLGTATHCMVSVMPFGMGPFGNMSPYGIVDGFVELRCLGNLNTFANPHVAFSSGASKDGEPYYFKQVVQHNFPSQSICGSHKEEEWNCNAFVDEGTSVIFPPHRNFYCCMICVHLPHSPWASSATFRLVSMRRVCLKGRVNYQHRFAIRVGF
jgi:hypothetical protein